MTKSKEELVQKNVYDVVGACMRIASSNPRVPQGAKTDPLLKQVRAFSRALESMEPSEVMEMAKSFYSNNYLGALTDDQWLEGDVALVFGESDPEINIRLRVSNYARVAKETTDTLLLPTLRYYALRLVQRLATKSVAEGLDEKIQPLEKTLGKSPMPAAAGSAAAAPNFMSTIMSSVEPMLKQLASNDETSPLKQLLANPNTAAMMRNMTASLPADMQAGLAPMLDDLQKGTFDIGKLLGRFAQAGTEEKPISTEGVQVPQLTLPPAEPETECTDDVCYPSDSHASEGNGAV